MIRKELSLFRNQFHSDKTRTEFGTKKKLKLNKQNGAE